MPWGTLPRYSQTICYKYSIALQLKISSTHFVPPGRDVYMISSKKLLVIGYVWPEPESSAAGSRMIQLLEFFRNEGWQIIFASAAKESKHMAELDPYGIDRVSIKLNDPGFDSFLRKLNPQMVLFDRFMTEEQFGWRVQTSLPGALRILDMEDLHCLRYGRQQAVKAGQPFSDDFLINDIAKREIASVYRCDLSLVISEAEIEYMTGFFGVPPGLIHYLPYMLKPIDSRQMKTWPAFDKRNGFMTIGNFRHAPNLDSVRYLHEKIWPLIRQSLSGAELRVYGSYSSKKINQWHDPSSGFLINGRADNAAAEFSKARVTLAPLRFGAGLKGKLAESMLTGTPSVTTTVGAEGLAGEMPWPGSITDDPGEFADAAIRLHNNQGDWTKAQQLGADIINRRFPAETLSKQLGERVKLLQENIETHRKQNFTGAMLTHHTMASTRFMSRWIEEKNREK